MERSERRGEPFQNNGFFPVSAVEHRVRLVAGFFAGQGARWSHNKPELADRVSTVVFGSGQ